MSCNLIAWHRSSNHSQIIHSSVLDHVNTDKPKYNPISLLVFEPLAEPCPAQYGRNAHVSSVPGWSTCSLEAWKQPPGLREASSRDCTLWCYYLAYYTKKTSRDYIFWRRDPPTDHKPGTFFNLPTCNDLVDSDMPPGPPARVVPHSPPLPPGNGLWCFLRH